MIKKKTKQNDFTAIGQNISILMEACGIDATELSKQTGLPCSTISRLRSNLKEFSPNISSLLPIADYFCISLSQLIGEEPINKDRHGKFKPIKMRKLPLPILHAENILMYLDDDNISDQVSFLDVDLALSENAYAYLYRGNSMEPHFPDKTLLIMDATLEPENLDYVLILPLGKKLPIFRQILIDAEEKYIRTMNPAFNEFVKISQETHKILGVMVQSRMNYREVNLSITNIEDLKKTKAS